jgi:CRP/FNR family transcriptional regulator, cyclic AMP receptor protein
MGSILNSCEEAKKREIVAGTTLLTEGTKTGYIYVLAHGVVEVVRGETTVAVIREPGAVFGEMSVLLDVPHTATVRTTTPCTVYAYDDAEAFMRSDPTITFAVARLLAQRLNSATTYLVDLKRQYAGQGNHLGMVSDVLASLVNQQQPEFLGGSDRQPDPRMNEMM